VIWLHTPTVFWLGGGTISLSCSKKIHTTEPLVPEPSAFEDEMAIEKLKRHKSPGTDQTTAEMINAGGRTIHSEIHKVL
jgi:hypothetical protein